jgi:hypothetical protein
MNQHVFNTVNFQFFKFEVGINHGTTVIPAVVESTINKTLLYSQASIQLIAANNQSLIIWINFQTSLFSKVQGVFIPIKWAGLL